MVVRALGLDAEADHVRLTFEDSRGSPCGSSLTSVKSFYETIS
jgi:hypothetical protein